MKFHESGAFFGPVRQINPKSPSAVPTGETSPPGSRRVLHEMVERSEISD